MSRKLEVIKRHSTSGGEPILKNHSDLKNIFIHPASAVTSNGTTSTLIKCKSGSTFSEAESSSLQKCATLTRERQNTLKSFFHRIGSTGMLSHKSHNLVKQQAISDQHSLYRSSSTSQLTTSPSYVKCDDPTEGVSLAKGSSLSPDCLSNSSQKSSSCDNLENIEITPEIPRKGNFPYAFLRSKLSVLPEENGGSVLKQSLNNIRRSTEYGSDVLSFCGSDLSYKKNGIYRNSVIKRYSSDDSAISNYSISCNSNISPTTTPMIKVLSENISRNNSISSKDWEPAYQRLSSCLSSNESGYDSDGGALILLNPTASDKRNSLSSMNSTISTATSNGSSSSSSSNHSSIARNSDNCVMYDYETATIRRRFRQIRLEKQFDTDFIGITLAPKSVTVNVGFNNNIDFMHQHEQQEQIRYLIVEFDEFGLAQR